MDWALTGGAAKVWFVVGLALNVIGALIMIVVISPLMLLIPTILRRVGSGATGSATRTMILDIAPPSRRGEAMTNFATSHNIAIAFGPAVGLAIYSNLGSTQLFIASAAIMGASALFLIPVKRTEQRAPDRRPGDAEDLATPSGGWVNTFIVREAIVPTLVVLLLSAAYLATTTFVSILGEERENPELRSLLCRVCLCRHCRTVAYGPHIGYLRPGHHIASIACADRRLHDYPGVH